MNPITLSLRLLARQGRSGALLMLLVALAVATAALSAVSLFTDRVSRALEHNAGELLAADLVIAGRQAIPEHYADAARTHGLTVARTISASTVIFAGDESLLVDIKGVSAGYPLRGQLRLGEIEQRAATQGPDQGEAWADARVMRGLDMRRGDELEIGLTVLPVTEVLAYEPDRGSGIGILAPRVMVHMETLQTAGLLAPGARADHRLLIAGDERDVTAFRAWLRDELESGFYLRSVSDAEAQTGFAMEQARRFLSMAALTAVILAAMAVLLAARRYADGQRDLVALLKCFGAGQGRIFAAVALLMTWLVLVAAATGIAAGWIAQSVIAELMAGSPAGELPGARWQPAAMSALFTALLALGFALPALLGLGGVPPMRILNRSLDKPSRWWRLGYLLAVGLALAIPLWQLGDTRLVVILLGGSLVLAVTLALAGVAAMIVTRRLASGAGPAWRIGLSGLDRRRGAGVLQITALGLGLMALLLLLIVRAELLDQWRAGIPEGTPNHFLLNIQADQAGAVTDRLRDIQGEEIQLRPMATGRVVRINDLDAEQRRAQVPAGEFPRGQVNISWAGTLPPANRLVAGDFWPEDAGSVEISLAETWAQRLSLDLGDRMTFQVGERELTGEITSIRAVEWDSFNVNFFILLNPAAGEQLPHQLIGSFYLPPRHATQLREITRAFPNVSVLDTEAILNRVREIIDRVSQAAQVVFLFTLAAGLVVLLAALQATREERRHESALIRTLGGDNGLVRRSLLVEYTIMALIAGGLAVAGAAGTGWLLARELFEFDYAPSPALFALGLGGSLLLVVGAGWLGNRAVLTTPPIRILRA